MQKASFNIFDVDTTVLHTLYYKHLFLLRYLGSTIYRRQLSAHVL